MQQAGIMENVSKKQRGRPRLLDKSRLALIEFATDAKTLRHKQNVHYRTRALALLMEDKRFLWLCDPVAMRAGKAHSMRPTILSELGRIENDGDLESVALQLCELKPKVRQAIVMIRQWRTGKVKEGDSLKLANEIIASVNGYIDRYPTTTASLILEALSTARAAVVESELE